MRRGPRTVLTANEPLESGCILPGDHIGTTPASSDSVSSSLTYIWSAMMARAAGPSAITSRLDV